MGIGKLLVGCAALMFGPVAEEVETPEPPVVNEVDEETIIEEIKAWLSQYLGESLVEKIVTWVTTGGLATALLSVYVKFRKYKATSGEEFTKIVKTEVIKLFSEYFDKYADTAIIPLKENLEKVMASNEIMMKALVLAQDKTAEGKIALLDLINEHAKNEGVTKVITEVKEVIKEEQRTVEEVKETVKGDYNPID